MNCGTCAACDAQANDSDATPIAKRAHRPLLSEARDRVLGESFAAFVRRRSSAGFHAEFARLMGTAGCTSTYYAVREESP